MANSVDATEERHYSEEMPLTIPCIAIGVEITLFFFVCLYQASSQLMKKVETTSCKRTKRAPSIVKRMAYRLHCAGFFPRQSVCDLHRDPHHANSA